jgi:hypothetical protein
MPDNLSVSVTADTSELRAQLALAQADLKAFGAETRKLANDIRSGGDAGGVLRSQLEQVAGQFNKAKSEVAGLTKELSNAANDNGPKTFSRGWARRSPGLANNRPRRASRPSAPLKRSRPAGSH